jgi:hypothetical protein
MSTQTATVVQKKVVTTLPKLGSKKEVFVKYIEELLGVDLADPDIDAKYKIQTNVEYSPEVKKIILPEGMSKKAAADDLMNQWNNEEQIQEFVVVLEGWDWKDGLRAFKNVIEEKFGWLKGRPTWRGNPSEISIVTGFLNGVQQSESAFYGPCSFPAFENAEGEVSVTGSGEAFCKIKGKKKFSLAINVFFNEVRQYLANNSIYRNKPVVVTQSGWGTPELTITELKSNPKIVLNENERLVVNNLILGQLQDPGKRVYLFTGDYGNGKSETAMNIAVDAIKQGVSFFYLKNTKMFSKLLTFAKKYEPAIVFVEDIDEIAAGEQRDAEMNQILNTLDGVETKGRNLTVLFTTNHEKRINPALRRPGRIDLIVKFSNPDRRSKELIYKSYVDHMPGSDLIDYHAVVDKTPEVQAAVVAEIAKRSVKIAETKGGTITTDIILSSIVSMEFHIEFMKGDVEESDPFKAFKDYAKEFIYNAVNN